MRNLKKIVAVVVTLVMLIGVVGVAASAETAGNIVISGRTQVSVNETEYELTVSLTKTGTVDGVEGVITYDPAVFDYTGVALAEYFTAIAGNPTDAASSVKVDETAGTIKFVGLDGQTGGDWFVLTFDVLAAAASTTFTGTAQGAAADGSTATYVDVTVEGLASGAYPDIVTAKYAELKADAADPDLRFALNYDLAALAEYDANATVKEYGVLVGLSRSIEGMELKVGMEETNSAVVRAKLNVSDFGGGLVYANVTNSHSDSKTMLGVRVTARAYIILEDGTEIYSNNDNDYVADGYSAEKSMIGCAKAAAKGIAADTTNSLTDEVRTRMAAYGDYTKTLPLTYTAPEDGSEDTVNPLGLSKTELLQYIQDYADLFVPAE